jgi:hypothetical protein
MIGIKSEDITVTPMSKPNIQIYYQPFKWKTPINTNTISEIRDKLSDIKKLYDLAMNDDMTRANVKQDMDECLDDYVTSNKILDYKVVCDETNNTASDIQNGILNASVFIQPTKTSNFIQLDIDLPEVKTEWVLRKMDKIYTFTLQDDDIIDTMWILCEDPSKSDVNITVPIEKAREYWKDLKNKGFVEVKD